MAHPRPSTSGGVPTKGSSRVNFDKRMSKDDMFFNSARYKHIIDKRMSRDDTHIKSRSTFMSQHRVPVGGPTITPKQSPLSPVTRKASIAKKVHIPESRTSGDIPIGMAIGSPSLPTPDASNRPAQLPLASNPPMIASQSSAVAVASTGSLQRKKTGRRKLLGLFGSGRKTENAQGPGPADATIEKPPTSIGRLRGASASSVQVSAKGTPARSNTQTERKLSKHKPSMTRSQTLPYSADESATPPEAERAGRPNLRSKASEPNIRPGILHQRSRADMAVPPVPSFLDIQIPDTTLERYSVMFSDVLNEAPKQETAVSLLARRQATLERLKMMNGTSKAEEIEKDTPRQRRATSPARTQSPKLTLFPMPPAGRITPGMDTPKTQPRLTRANTSPGILPSPTRASFDTRQGPTLLKASHAKTLAVPNPFESTPSPTMPKPGRKEPDPIYPTDTGFHFGPDDSGPMLESPIDMEPSEEIIIAQPFKPTLHEPQWQMVSPPPPATATASESSPKAPSVLSSATSGGRRRSPSIASSAPTHATKPSSEIDDADAAFQNAVKDSIARQISISRQQRALLRPLQTRRATGGPVGAAVGVGTAVMSPPTRRGVVQAEDKAIRETKIATPTLVNPREQAVNPAHLAQNRKSSWAVVEGD
ncbi:hypothetical protein VPNG_01735 [Cytospora leucostoma]|uniref:Uncharacterized protein n=1 Tax=Cytospora leucostoma TaxID=1230097 RepID=A0A423XKE3_9PEZI|nr:hypothetical protein VPNG_01735 [Cytospora leucostoma]